MYEGARGLRTKLIAGGGQIAAGSEPGVQGGASGLAEDRGSCYCSPAKRRRASSTSGLM